MRPGECSHSVSSRETAARPPSDSVVPPATPAGPGGGGWLRRGRVRRHIIRSFHQVKGLTLAHPNEFLQGDHHPTRSLQQTAPTKHVATRAGTFSIASGTSLPLQLRTVPSCGPAQAVTGPQCGCSPQVPRSQLGMRTSMARNRDSERRARDNHRVLPPVLPSVRLRRRSGWSLSDSLRRRSGKKRSSRRQQSSDRRWQRMMAATRTRQRARALYRLRSRAIIVQHGSAYLSDAPGVELLAAGGPGGFSRLRAPMATSAVCPPA